MAKYSYELKREIVEEYLSGKSSYRDLAMKYQIEKSVLRLWVNNYKHFGDEGLMRFCWQSDVEPPTKKIFHETFITLSGRRNVKHTT